LMDEFAGEVRLIGVEHSVIGESIYRSISAVLFIRKRFRVCSLPETPTVFGSGRWKGILSQSASGGGRYASEPVRDSFSRRK
jgi:hypothetical protein